MTDAGAAERPGILHCDLDAFFASVEQRDDPSLRGRPVVVGGTGGRGVVAAASYEARRFGIHSAMPTSQARRACPDAVFLPPRFEAYREASGIVMDVFRSVTPLVEPISLDEAFLDVRGARRRLGTGPEIAADLRAQVRAATGLTVSVGVATTKFLAKLASDRSKPDGLLVVEPGEELAFLHPLPVECLWGVGPATHARLARFGVRTVGDLAALGEATLITTLGESHGRHLHALAHNVDERSVEPERTLKSVGHEETFPVDHRDPAVLRRELVRLADRTGSRLRAAGRAGRTVQLKVRFADFSTITRSRTLERSTDSTAVITATARDLLDAVDVARGVRLLGVSVQSLVEPGEDEPAVTAEALTLALDFGDGGGDSGGAVGADVREGRSDPTGDPDPARRAVLERAVDEARRRFGPDSVRPASLAAPPPSPLPSPPGSGPAGDDGSPEA